MLKFAIAIAVIIALAALLGGCVERLFFYPDSAIYTTPEQLGLRHQEVAIPLEGQAPLHGWFLPAAGTAKGTAKGTVLHLHGNAANISNHLPLVAWLPREGFNVLLFDYRGFGRSPGRPTLNGVLEDAAAALAYLRSRPDVDRARLIVFGQSLGGATALRLLARDGEGVKLAIVEAAFASYRGIARDAAMQGLVLAPLLPLALPHLPSAEDDPVTAVARIQVPLLIVHGARDGVIALKHSEQLFAAASGRKQLLRVEGAGHLEPLMSRDVQAQVLANMVEAVK